MTSKEPLERGSGLIALRIYIQKRYGTVGEKEILSKLPEDTVKVYNEAITHEWYPVRHTRILLDALYEKSGKDDSVILEVAAAQAQTDVKGIVRFLVLFATPHQLVKRSSKLWSQYVNAGKMRYEKLASRSCEIIREGYSNGPLDCLMVAGFMKELASFTGAKNVEVTETECVEKGAKACRWKITWNP